MKKCLIGILFGILSSVTLAQGCHNRTHDAQDLSSIDRGSTKTKRIYSYDPCWSFVADKNYMTWSRTPNGTGSQQGPRVTLIRNGHQVKVKVTGYLQPQTHIGFVIVHVDIGTPDNRTCNVTFSRQNDPTSTDSPPAGEMMDLPGSCGSDIWDHYTFVRLRMEWGM
jgi:hypothetical protein